jgi:hypothetical protein
LSWNGCCPVTRSMLPDPLDLGSAPPGSATNLSWHSRAPVRQADSGLSRSGGLPLGLDGDALPRQICRCRRRDVVVEAEQVPRVEAVLHLGQPREIGAERGRAQVAADLLITAEVQVDAPGRR